VRFGIRKTFRILAPGNSLQKRTAYSLALVRLILVPVFCLTVYYLFRMGHILDRIVNVDAPAATLSQQASIEMLKARRSARNYLLLHDPKYLDSNRQEVELTREDLDKIRVIEADEEDDVEMASQALALYQQRLEAGLATLEESSKGSGDRIQAVVTAYEGDLDQFLRRANRTRRDQLVEELRKRIDSFDSQIIRTAQQDNPKLRKVTSDLNDSSEEVLKIASELESRNWDKVRKEHAEARDLIRQAERSVSIVSAITLLTSIWVSFILPRQVVKPLLELKKSIDHAAAGNFEIEFDVQGKGEIVELAASLRNMFAAVQKALSTEKQKTSLSPGNALD
jgi:methyl-accepting chemotaxis protein